jgi:hypothetical protein
VPVGVDRGIRGDLRSVDGDGAEPGHACGGSNLQHLSEQVRKYVLLIDPEPGDGGVIRYVLRAQHSKRHVNDAALLDLPR